MSGIHIKPSRKGLLHKDTGTPEGQPIPESKIHAAENSKDPAVRKRAVFAENAKHFHHPKKRSMGSRMMAHGNSNSSY